MKTWSLAIALSCVAVAVWSASSRTAKADFGGDEVVILHNATNATIQFQVKWDNGAWRTFSLAAGRQQSFDASQGAPAVRFDHVRGDNQITYKGYRLQPNTGYDFRLSPDGRRLDLYANEVITD